MEKGMERPDPEILKEQQNLFKFSKSLKLKDSPKTGVQAPKGPAPLFSGSYFSFRDLLKLRNSASSHE